jgi:hypothetical protein
MTKLETLLGKGLPPLYQWIEEEATKYPSFRFQPNTSLASPVALYLSAHLGGKRVAIYGWTVEYRNQRVELPPEIGRFLLKCARVFGNTKPSAEEVQAWLQRSKTRVFSSYETALQAAQERQRAQRRSTDFGIVKLSSTTRTRYRVYPFDACSQNEIRDHAVVSETVHLVARLARTGRVQVFDPPSQIETKNQRKQ